MALKIKKNDTVVVLAGKDKKKTGKVLFVLPKKSMVVVSGINIVKKHKKPSISSAGGIISVEQPIHISNVSLIDDKKPAKVGFKFENNKKVRYFKKSGNKAGE